jgi:hydrogenase maturation protein HypF
MKRTKLTVRGRVQGVGFRPAVYRVARGLGLTGWVMNSPEGVVVEVQGEPSAVDSFPGELRSALPPLALITELTVDLTPPLPAEREFRIEASSAGSGHHVLISPDVATCPECLDELGSPVDRRHLYPFINCTNCGPRYTITRSIPYDRSMTSMDCFPMCADCLREYEDPRDRRFHAQPNACPACGPRVWMTDRQGVTLCEHDEAIQAAAQRIMLGEIGALKGLGGFHLACDAFDDAAVEELRKRKHRWGKPLAVMVPDLGAAGSIAEISPAEERWLVSVQRPILLLRGRANAQLSFSISPDTERIGLLLPYTPLHHALFHHLRQILPPDSPAALVMTSGNMSSEPIALGNREALSRLGRIADFYLLHNRDILIRCDDSVMRINPATDEPELFRRARGFTPSPVFLPASGPSVLGTGPQLKCTLTLIKDDQAFVSQHIGDMENLETLGFYHEIRAHLMKILRTRPELIVCDLHPDYLTTGYALEQDEHPVLRLQHHAAHIYAVAAEHGTLDPLLGLALDGTGYGEDGTLWGGEALLVDPGRAEHRRLGHFSPVGLPGGDAAIREPWRIAQSYLYELGIIEPRGPSWTWLEEHAEASGVVGQMLAKTINCPLTTSCGRLFDAVSGLLGLKHVISYEGQAAIVLEKIQNPRAGGRYDCPVRTKNGIVLLDTLELFAQVHRDWRDGVSSPVISRRFHLGLIRGLADWARVIARVSGVGTVALSGGVMQNLTISTELPRALLDKGLTPLVHTQVPPNDACISLGQAFFGQRTLLRVKHADDLTRLRRSS